MAHFFAGKYHRAIEIMLEFAEELKGPHRHERLGSTGTSSCNWLGNIAGAYARLGEFDQAIAYGEEAVQIARETSRPFDMCIASLWLGTACGGKGEAERAAANFDLVLRLARENEIGFMLAWVGLGIAEAYRLLGKARDAAAIVEESLAAARTFKLAIAEEWSVLGKCDVHLATGALEDAVDCGRRALEIAQSRGYPWCEGVALRLLGTAYAQFGRKHFGDAERCLTGAIERATSLQARPELAHAYRERGKLFATADRLTEAQICFSQAVDLYQTMGMAVWVEEAERLRAQAKSD
jgi:tetratricopeptide (TPR) repeat protein